MPRFFVDAPPEQGYLMLTDEQAHHASRVLRVRVGQSVTVCNGKGTDYDCTVHAIARGEVVCRVLNAHPCQTEPKQWMQLFFALPKGEKADLVVQKAVELGVSEIFPYLSTNCVVRTERLEHKLTRWRKIALEAAKQCGRGIIPEVHELIDFTHATACAAKSQTKLFCYEFEREVGLRDVLTQGVADTVSLMVGPEGGFTVEEAAQARQAGLCSVSLGARILRCETAPLAALAAVLYAGGNM